MPNVTAIPISERDNDEYQIRTYFIALAGTVSQTFTYPTVQYSLTIRNKSDTDTVTVTVNGTVYTITKSSSQIVVAPFTSFDISSSSNSQAFEATATRGNSYDQIGLLLDGYTAYVDTAGNDTTAVLGRRDKKFATINAALDALPSTGGVVKLGFGVFAPITGVLTKENVHIIGSGMPRMKADYTGFQGGTIIQGPLIFRANNLTFKDFGVDSGSAVCTALYGGVAQEGFGCFFTSYTTPLKGVRIENISAICKDQASLVHGILLEGLDGAEIHNIESTFGTHGVAFKVIGSNISNVMSRGHSSDGIIIKSAAASYMKNSNFSNLYVESINTNDTGTGLILQANENVSLENVNINNVLIRGTTNGFSTVIGANPNDTISAVNISNMVVITPNNIGVTITSPVIRLNFTNVHVINSVTSHGFDTADTMNNILFNGCTASNCGGNGFNLGGIVDISNCKALNNTGYGFNAKASSTVYRNNCSASGNTAGAFNQTAYSAWKSRTSEDVIAPTLLGTWVNYSPVSGNRKAGYYKTEDGVVRLRGFVKSGTVASNIFTLPLGYRPTDSEWFPVVTDTGYGNISIDTNGNVTYQSGGTGYVSLSGISFRIDM